MLESSARLKYGDIACFRLGIETNQTISETHDPKGYDGADSGIYLDFFAFFVTNAGY
jgi:hypothetical protein